ncbi:MAG: DnaJ domain-containing protein [Deltaproteobacteria bacterium]|nr:DnaJ domain-containing protein [Deltaproteobacteria bacterium]
MPAQRPASGTASVLQRPEVASLPAGASPSSPSAAPASATKAHPAERPAKKISGPPPVLGAPTTPGALGARPVTASRPAMAPGKPPLPAPAPAPTSSPAVSRALPPPAVAAPRAAPRPGPPPPPAFEVDAEFFAEMEAIYARLEGIDYFELFRLPRTATLRELKQAYYRESRTFHPDRFSQLSDEAIKERINSVFKRVTEAYVVLRDDKKRAKYLADIGGPDRAKKLRYTEESETEQKAAAKKALEEVVGTTPKGRECYKNGCKEFEAKRFDKAMQQLKMALMYEPANAKYKDKMKEAENEWDKTRPKDDFRIR